MELGVHVPGKPVAAGALEDLDGIVAPGFSWLSFACCNYLGVNQQILPFSLFALPFQISKS